MKEQSRAKEIFRKMNENEREGCKYIPPLFPRWVVIMKLTKEEIHELTELSQKERHGG